MALVVADRVQETTTTIGAGAISLAGAVAGYQSFAVIGNNNTTYYCITSGTEWEVGIGTYTTPPLLTRTTILASSASGAAISLTGTSNVFCVYPAGKSFGTDQILALTNGGTGATSAPSGVANLLGYTTTATTGGSTALANTSTVHQVFTGTSNQTITLPTTAILSVGWYYIFANKSTGTLTVQTPIGGTVGTVPAGMSLAVYCLSTASNAASSWRAGYTEFQSFPFTVAMGGTGSTTGAGGAANLMGFTTTATAGGSTALSNTSSVYQIFTGTLAQQISLPSTSTLSAGWYFHLVNNSTGTLTVITAGAVSLGTIPPGVTMMVSCIDTTVNTAAAWEVGYTDFSTITGTGNNVLSTSPTISYLSLAAGTATAGQAPLKMTLGTVLATPEAGAIEYDGNSFFSTEDTTSGRGRIPSEKIYRQTGNGTTTTAATIADFFPANSSISLSASTLYEIEVWAYFLKTTAGTVTFTMTASSAPTWMNGHYIGSGTAGITTAAAATTGWAGSAGATTAAWAATGSLTTAVNHGFRFKIQVLTNAATNWRMRYTSNTGTTQSLAGSYYIVRELPSASTGTFVA